MVTKSDDYYYTRPRLQESVLNKFITVVPEIRVFLTCTVHVQGIP